MAGKVDTVQAGIVKALRACGASVFVASNVRGGFPDLVCAIRGHWYLLEVKDPHKRGHLTPLQRKFIAEARATVHVVTSVNEALDAVGIRRTGAAA